ncbi:MAG: DUF2254 domain-containing protein [Thermoanaerobaculia bacterium]
MKARLLTWAENLRQSFWVVPGSMTVAAALLAFGTSWLDRKHLEEVNSEFWWLFTAGPDGARTLLSTIAGSTITVAGVVFSITIVALSLASQQYGPRLLRNFMKDRGTQMTLGTFTSVFLYSIIVLRTVSADNFSLNVPHISVTVAIALSILALGVFIYFVHHVSSSIQADVIIARVGAELDSSILELVKAEDDENGGELPQSPERAWATVRATRDAYIQAVDHETIVEEAARRDAYVELCRAPGSFVFCGAPLMKVSPPPEVGDQDWVRDNIALGSVRTPTQDVRFSLHLLVEMALRALSPSLNDPFTAIACIDRLSAALAQAGAFQIRKGVWRDSEGTARLAIPPVDFEDLVVDAYTQIRQSSSGIHAVSVHLLESIAEVLVVVVDPLRRAILVEEARKVIEGQNLDAMIAADRRRLELAWAAVTRTAAKEREEGIDA